MKDKVTPSKFKYLPQVDRKKILLLSDDLRFKSGISHMSREFVVGTSHHFNWVQVGAALNHPEVGKIVDVSEDVNKQSGLLDASVRIIPNIGYGDAQLVRDLIKLEKPDAIMIFTDPRYWIWLFEIEREVRSKIPIFYLNIWDNYPAPLYNREYYDSVDVLMAISKQTKNINEIVLGENAKNKVIEYVPHGVDEKVFFPIREGHGQYREFLQYKDLIFGGKQVDFTVFYNSRNIHRKRPGDVILAYRHFCDLIGPEKAQRCALIMHTDPIDGNGTDLRAVKEALCDPSYVNVLFSTDNLTPNQLNLLYNVADVTVLISSNEGWGLSLTESAMAGTMFIGAVTGGMQDQMRFEDKNGKWLDLTPDFPSNHRGTYSKCGEWAVPVFPTSIALTGSPTTPYIFDDRVESESVAEALQKVYTMSTNTRNQAGEKGREWMLSTEASMSSENMCKRLIEVMDKGFEVFVPRPLYEIIKVETLPKRYTKHKLTSY